MQFNFPDQRGFYKGKVRDVYTIGDSHLVMITDDRISAFDVVLPRAIPYKGQVLNQTAAYFLHATQDIVPNWLMETPDPVASLGIKCEPLKIEMVIRGYLVGHAAREYALGKRILCGVALPDGLKENDKLPNPIITPTTKADKGHDVDISEEEILTQGIVSHQDWDTIKGYTQSLYRRGTEMAAEKGLILADTKYEFGKTKNGQILLIDEVHTPDSSRYFYQAGFDERQAKGEPQKQLSKEFVRQWLIERGFQGKEGQQIPEMTDDFVQSVSSRYIELYNLITGKVFEPAPDANLQERIFKNVAAALERMKEVS